MLKEKSLNLNFVFCIVTLVFIFTIFFLASRRFSADTEALLELFSSYSRATLRHCLCPSLACSHLSRAGICLKRKTGGTCLNFTEEKIIANLVGDKEFWGENRCSVFKNIYLKLCMHALKCTSQGKQTGAQLTCTCQYIFAWLQHESLAPNVLWTENEFQQLLWFIFVRNKWGACSFLVSCVQCGSFAAAARKACSDQAAAARFLPGLLPLWS